MIQRKQTLYLFFAGLVTLILLFIPFGKFFIGDDPCFEYNAFTVKTISEKTVILSTIGNAVLLIATSVLSFITIFLYKKRKLQIKLISFNMLLVLVAICTIMYVYPNLVFTKNINFVDTTLGYNYAILISFVSAIGLYFAKKAILKDEALLKSAERLR
jgi:hypothetical protein